MSELDQIKKEAQIEIVTTKLLEFYKNNKKKVIFSGIFVFFLAIFVVTYSFHIKNINQKYSVILQELFLQDDFDNKKLQELVEQNNSKAIKLVASMQYAKILIREGKIDEAINLYLTINKDRDHDQFFREYAGLMAIKYLIEKNDNKKYDILNIINRIEKDSSNLKDHITEQKAIYFWKNKMIKESEEIFQKLLKNIETPEKIRQRERIMIEIGIN